MKFDFPEGPAGIHPPTAALSRILQTHDVINPLTEAPYTESFLLGVGGGLDAGYILFQFKHLPNPMLVLGFRNRWNHTHAFLENLTNRLNFQVAFHEFSEEKTAQTALQETIKAGKTALVWVDKTFLPYHELPESLKGYINHQVAVYARDGRLWRLFLDDLSTKPFEVREKIFSAGRANLPQNNFLMMVFEEAGSISERAMRNAIMEGIQDCASQLNRPVKTLGISTLETWSKKLTDRTDRLGWPQVFNHQKGLYAALRTIYEAIRLEGTEGFALRKTYADFLHDAATILENPALNAVAGQYLQLSNHWANLAENALPSKIPAFDRVKNLLNKKYLAFKSHNLKQYSKTTQDLRALETRIIGDFPLDSYETSQLYDRLARQVKLVAELELSAALRLRDLSLS